VSDAAALPRNNGLLGLGGPTAVGKSEVALELAERFGAEIISVDSMQVYRGMDIGTAKPTPKQRARVAHHLIDVVDVTKSFDVAQFVALADQAVQEIRSRGRLPLLCGGTGLYFRAFLDGLGQAPPASPALRAELEAAPLEQLLRELAELDRVAYERIDRQNPRRVIRALEVVRLTGKPYSLQRADWSANGRLSNRSRLFGLMRGPEELDKRIQARVDAMFEQGLVAETETLLRAGLNTNRTARQALGYRQVAEYLQGVRSLPETIALTKVRTRQFAKRQMTWFRRQLQVEWFEIASNETAEQTADKLAKRWKTLRS
jgi:tRNA dimethylallyltransferase